MQQLTRGNASRLTWILLVAVAALALMIVSNWGPWNSGAAHAAVLSCGDTITADTTLTANVVCPGGYNGVGLEIQASGVTLYGNGYRVIGGGGSSSKGVQVSGQANVVVKSIQLENFRIGIYAPMHLI